MLRGRTAALFLAGTLWAGGPPVIREMTPRGAQQGTAVQLSFSGDGLKGSNLRVVHSLPGALTTMVPAAAKPGTAATDLAFLLEVRKDAPVGLYPLRVVTDDGASNVVLFSVGMLPEAMEEHEREAPQSLKHPVVVNGTLGPAEIDRYSVDVKTGERLVFETEARRAGSAIDSAIEVLDPAGKVIAKNDDAPGLGVDARLELTFAKAGRYTVRVHDSKYSDQQQNFYRLKIGSYQYADGVFPLGGKLGEEIEVSFVGGNLGEPVKTRVMLDAPRVQIRLPGSPALPFYLVGSPEGGFMIDGRLEKPAQVDSYPLAVKPGEQWMLELQAGALGTSRLDGLLSVYAPDGKKLFSRDDVGGADPALPFTAPEGVSELIVRVEDLLGRGGPAFGYRLSARKGGPDFTADVDTPFVNVPAGGTASVQVAVQRRGFEGPVQLKVLGLPEGFKVAGGHVPSEAAAQSPFTENMGYRIGRGMLTISAPSDAQPQTLDLTIVAEGDGPLGRITRAASTPGLVTPVRGVADAARARWMGLPLTMAVTRPLPAGLNAPSPLVRLSQGFEFELPWKFQKRGNIRMTRKVNNQVIGAVGNLRINQGPEPKSPDAGSVLVATNFASPVGMFDMLFDTLVEIDGQQVAVVSPAVEIEVVAGYEVSLERSDWTFAPGAKSELRGTLRREPTFEGGAVRVKAEDLPDGIVCGDTEIAPDARTFVIACEAGAQVATGSYEIRITSVAPQVGRKAKDDYKIADVPARLVVGKAAVASR